MATRIDVREEDKGVYPVDVLYGSEGDLVRVLSEKDMAVAIVEGDGSIVQVYNEEIDKLIEALQEIKKYVPSSAEDGMTNPANWRVGDIVEFVQGGRLAMTQNKNYKIASTNPLLERGCIVVLDDTGVADTLKATRFKWVSRSSK